MCKPNAKFFGFYADKYFISFQPKLEIENNKENLIEIEGENNNKESTYLRVFEHDLHNFERIKALDLPYPFTNMTNEYLNTGRFGKNREGYYIIKDNKDSNKAGDD